MSEEQTETKPDAEPAAAATTPTEAAPETEASQSEPEKGKEPPWFMKRINDMNRRNADLAREMDALKAERDLLRAAKSEGADKPAEKALSRDEIRAEAERLRAEERIAEQRQSLIDSGVKELGQDTWNAKTNVIAALGATDNAAFMDALVDLPGAHKLVVALADDPDKLQALLAKRPTAMAAEMGRMAAELASVKPKPISKTPAPVSTISNGRAQPDADVSKMSAREYIEWRNKVAPKHLGGRGQAA